MTDLDPDALCRTYLERVHALMADIVVSQAARLLHLARGIEPPVWRSGNAPGGDEANARFLGRFRHRVRAL